MNKHTHFVIGFTSAPSTVGARVSRDLFASHERFLLYRVRSHATLVSSVGIEADGQGQKRHRPNQENDRSPKKTLTNNPTDSKLLSGGQDNGKAGCRQVQVHGSR